MSPQGQPKHTAGAIGPRSHPGVSRITARRSPRTTPSGYRGDHARPELRLVHPPDDTADSHATRDARHAAAVAPAAIMDTADPRWVLAVRTSQCLQGTILPPEQRDRLLILARLLRLTPFDANLIIAIVQDQARRGHAKDACAAAGRSQLAMIPLPTKARLRAAIARRRPWRTIALVVGFLTVELLFIALWMWMR